MLLGNRVGEFHFAHVPQFVEPMLECILSKRDARSQRVETTSGRASSIADRSRLIVASYSRTTPAHLRAPPRLQIGRIAKGFKIEFLDYFMQKNSDRTAASKSTAPVRASRESIAVLNSSASNGSAASRECWIEVYDQT